ncbi:MAG TPA: hypothetical protein VNO30_50745 [Kofleriaceae bacterium]|nr:hypothetical protein [Kofleriaceae bacterium]
MTRLHVTLGALLAMAGSASAQAVATFDPSDAVAPVSVVEGPGVKIGEGTVLHPIFGAETGFISNVFYEDQDENPAGVLRLLAQIGAGSLPLSRLTSPGMLTLDEAGDPQTSAQSAGNLQYRADARLSYDLLLSNNERTTRAGAGGLGAGGTLRMLVNPLRTWSFGFAEEVRRLIRSANFETDADTNRIINDVKLRLFFQPQGRTLGGFLRYDNTIDYFERDRQRFSNRIQHTFGARVMWRLLPMTRIYADASIGIFGPLGGDSVKASSYPFVGVAGLQTLLSLNLTVSLQGGYTYSPYSMGPSYSAPVVGAEIGYRYSPLGRVTAMYQYMHQDSVNANFFRDHVVRLWLQQMYVPFALTLQPELHLRKYQGITIVDGPATRDDVIFSMAAGVHYNFRNWIAGTLGYNLGIVRTDYRYRVPMSDGRVVEDDPSYIRHELVLGVRVAM